MQRKQNFLFGRGNRRTKAAQPVGLPHQADLDGVPVQASDAFDQIFLVILECAKQCCTASLGEVRDYGVHQQRDMPKNVMEHIRKFLIIKRIKLANIANRGETPVSEVFKKHLCRNHAGNSHNLPAGVTHQAFR